MGSVERIVARSKQGRRWAKTIADRLDAPTATVAARIGREVGLSQSEIDQVVGQCVSVAQLAQLDAIGAPQDGWSDPWLVGEVYEYAVSGRERQRRGAWYTPRDVARRLVWLSHETTDVPLHTVDPCCGGGGFLLAAAERLAERCPPSEVLRMLGGHDIDVGAVAATRTSLVLWAAGEGVSTSVAVGLTAEKVTVADSLTDEDTAWPPRRCVVGNPPFASPLKLGTVAPNAEAYRNRHADELGPYADLASLHLHHAVITSGPGSVVALVQPQSILAGRDGRGLREMIERNATLAALWVTRRAVFDAGTRVCAPVLEIDGHTAETVLLAADGGDAAYPVAARRDLPSPRSGGNGEDANRQVQRQWSELAAVALGAPDVPTGLRAPTATIGSIAKATAGFRDEYYGLASAAQEGPDAGDVLKLLTVGSVEPLVTTWGVDQLRLAGQHWDRPVVALDDLDPKVRRWTESQLQPKIVLATQSKILEPVIDADGDLIPLTPLVSVLADVDDLPLLAAVLLAPPVVALAWQQTFGTAMSVDAVKLAARDVLALPLPSNRRLWEKAATLLTRDELTRVEGNVGAGWALALEVGGLMTRAYGAESDVFDWWCGRAKASWRAGVEPV